MKTTAPKQKASGKATPNVPMKMDAPPRGEDRLAYIATAAYYRAEARGFVPGQELDDWLEAEANFRGAERH